MRVTRYLAIALAIAGLLLTTAPTAPVSASGGTQLTASLTGTAEVPGPGDANGTGTATLTLQRRKICFEITVNDIEPATFAHIHEGAPDVAGPILIFLNPPPTDGSSEGCARASRRLIKRIRENPAGFYVNVHNDPFPMGAVRGQLSAI